MSWTFEQSPTEGSERLVLLALADNANDEGVCWPSLNTIARKCSLERRSVIRLVAQLVDKGLLTVQRRWEGITNLTNLYRICWTDEIRQAEEVTDLYLRTLAEFKNSRAKYPRGGDTESLGVVTQSHQGSDIESLGVVTRRHQGGDTESPESSLNHKRQPSLKPSVEPPPPTSSNAAVTVQDEEALPQGLRDELLNFGIFTEVIPTIAAVMQQKNLSAEDVRAVMRRLAEKHEPERAAALLLTRLKNLRQTTSAIGYAHKTQNSSFPVCSRCSQFHVADFTVNIAGKDVCLDCLTDAEYPFYVQEGE